MGPGEDHGAWGQSWAGMTAAVVSPPAEEALWTTRADGRVRLRIEPSCPQQPPYTVHQMFCQTLEKYGDLRALGFKRQGSWEHICYSQYYLLARKAAKGFLKVRSPQAGLSLRGLLPTPHWASP